MDDGSAITLDAPIAPMIEWRREGEHVPYDRAMQEMRDRVQAIRASQSPEQVWLLEHPPVFTAGTSAKPEDLFNPRGFPTYDAGRGGQWTYHGPGQRIAYVMIDLQRAHGRLAARDIRCFVHDLEEWLIATLARLGIESGRRNGRIGVWVTDPETGSDKKIAALGVRVTKWVSWHGVSINLAPDLDHFDGIVPCGIREHGVTSIRALGRTIGFAELDTALALSWPAIFGGPAPFIQEA